jgi:sugar phosphate isomerase/epimerase
MPSEVIKHGVVATALADNLRQSPRRARELGFAGLQFDADLPTLRIPDLPTSGRREFLRLLSSEDRQLIGLRFDAGPRGFGPGADVDRILDRLEKVMESAAGMVAPLICLDVGPLPAPPLVSIPRPRVTPDQAGLILLPTNLPEPQAPAPSPIASVDPALYSQIDSALEELGRRADHYSVILAFRSDLASFAALDRALRSANCPWFGIDLDPAAVLRDEWAMDEVLAALIGQIRHVRGRDAVAGPDRRTRPAVIGKGNTNWGELLADLDSAGYHGWLTIDPIELSNRLAAAEAGLKHLKSLAVTGR